MGTNIGRHRSFVLKGDYNVLVIILSRKSACQLDSVDAHISLRKSDLPAPLQIDEGVKVGPQLG